MKTISKKTWIIIVGAVVAVIAVIGVVLLATHRNIEAPAPGEELTTAVPEEAPAASGKKASFRVTGGKPSAIKPGDLAGTTSPTAVITNPPDQDAQSAPIIELDGTQYRLASFNGYTFPDDSAYTLSFADNRLSAKFCNGTGGSYMINGTLIKASGMVSTMMYCETPETLMDAEQAFSKMMQSGAEYSMMPGTLTLKGNGYTFVYAAYMK